MSTMNPRQKRSIGIILAMFGLAFMAGGVGFMLYCLKTGIKTPPAIGLILLTVFMPLCVFGVILISQAKKELEGEEKRGPQIAR